MEETFITRDTTVSNHEQSCIDNLKNFKAFMKSGMLEFKYDFQINHIEFLLSREYDFSNELTKKAFENLNFDKNSLILKEYDVQFYKDKFHYENHLNEIISNHENLIKETMKLRNLQKQEKKKKKFEIPKSIPRNNSFLMNQSSKYSREINLEEQSKRNWEQDFKRSERLIIKEIEDYLIAQNKFATSQEKREKANEEHQKEIERVKMKANSFNRKALETLFKNKKEMRRYEKKALEKTKEMEKKKEEINSKLQKIKAGESDILNERKWLLEERNERAKEIRDSQERQINSEINDLILIREAKDIKTEMHQDSLRRKLEKKAKIRSQNFERKKNQCLQNLEQKEKTVIDRIVSKIIINEKKLVFLQTKQKMLMEKIQREKMRFNTVVERNKELSVQSTERLDQFLKKKQRDIDEKCLKVQSLRQETLEDKMLERLEREEYNKLRYLENERQLKLKSEQKLSKLKSSFSKIDSLKRSRDDLLMNGMKTKVENQRKKDKMKKEIEQFSNCKDPEQLKNMIQNSHFKMDKLIQYFDEIEARNRKNEDSENSEY